MTLCKGLPPCGRASWSFLQPGSDHTFAGHKRIPGKEISSTSMLSDKEAGLLLLGLFWMERNSTSCGLWWIRETWASKHLVIWLHGLDLSGITSARGGTSGTSGRGSWCLHKNIQHLYLPQRYCSSGYHNGTAGMTKHIQNYIYHTLSQDSIQHHRLISNDPFKAFSCLATPSARFRSALGIAGMSATSHSFTKNTKPVEILPLHIEIPVFPSF